MTSDSRTCAFVAYNKFETVMTFLKAKGIRGLVGKNDWPRYTEEEPVRVHHFLFPHPETVRGALVEIVVAKSLLRWSSRQGCESGGVQVPTPPIAWAGG